MHEHEQLRAIAKESQRPQCQVFLREILGTLTYNRKGQITNTISGGSPTSKCFIYPRLLSKWRIYGKGGQLPFATTWKYCNSMYVIHCYTILYVELFMYIFPVVSSQASFSVTFCPVLCVLSLITGLVKFQTRSVHHFHEGFNIKTFQIHITRVVLKQKKRMGFLGVPREWKRPVPGVCVGWLWYPEIHLFSVMSWNFIPLNAWKIGGCRDACCFRGWNVLNVELPWSLET